MLIEEFVMLFFMKITKNLRHLRQVQMMMISLIFKGSGLLQTSVVKKEVLQSCRKLKLLKHLLHLLEILVCLRNGEWKETGHWITS